MDRAKIKQMLDSSLNALATSIEDLKTRLNAELDAPDPVATIPTLASLLESSPVGATLLLSGEYIVDGPIKIDKPLILKGPATIRYSGGIDTGLFTLSRLVTFFDVADLTVFGGKANYVIRSDGASNIKAKNVTSLKADGKGCGIFFGNGVNGVTLDNCKTEFTTVYSFYCGGSETSLNNKNIVVKNCSWGKSDSHCMRTYGVSGMLIENTTFSNPKSKSGRQCIKVMNGENITVRGCSFDGTTRFGRDINDPKTYTLKNVLLDGNDFKDWTRTDSDNVTYRNSTVFADGDGFCFHLKGKTVLEGIVATYAGAGGAFASDKGNIVSMKNISFNGKKIA